MKPFEILSSLPQWTKLDQDAIVDSPAFAMPCRLGEENVTLLLGAVRPADAIRLSITIEDEPHVLSFARSSRFRELDAIWDGLADVPEPIVLALVEKDAGPVLQLVENAVRRKIRLVGLAESDAADAREFVAQIGDVVFSLIIPAVAEYAAFALSPVDAAGLAVGDAVLLPELDSSPARLIAGGQFAVDDSGVSRYSDGELVHVFDAEPRDLTLGELFDAAETPHAVEAKPSGALKLVGKGRTLAVGRLERLGDQPALIVESTSH